MDMFTIRGLHVYAGEREVIRGLDLSMKAGEVHAIMGPNGAGKSTLAEALMGHPALKASGSVMIGREELMGLPPDERSRKGLFLSFQNPEEVEGVKVSNLVRKAIAAREGGAQGLDRMVAIHEGLITAAKRLGMEKEAVSRELNVGFSGGEKKRLEALQMVALRPRVAVLDEIDSGLDVDGVKLIARAINEMRDGSRCFLIITHYPRILRYVKPDRVHVLAQGRIVESGGERLAHEIEENGYSRFTGKPSGE